MDFRPFLPFMAFFSICLIGCGDWSGERVIPSTGGAPKNQPVFMVLPLGKVDQMRTQEAVSALKKYGGKVVLLPAVDFPSTAYYPPRNRYRADSLIHWMARMAKSNEVYIGLASADISTKKNDVKDFGVMGLGFKPGKACVVSSFRLRNKANFYKVVLHEAGHTSGLSHCPEKTCFMRDAKGGDPTGEETGFCGTCEKFLRSKGWSMAKISTKYGVRNTK